MPYAANVAVEVGGVCVVPGDYIYVDSSGGVVIPAMSLQRVFDMAHQVTAEDDKYLTQVRDERTRSAESDASADRGHAQSLTLHGRSAVTLRSPRAFGHVRPAVEMLSAPCAWAWLDGNPPTGRRFNRREAYIEFDRRRKR